MTIKWIVVIPLLVIAACTSAKKIRPGHAWPEITEVTKTVHVSDADSPDAGLEFDILGLNGRKLYDVKCHSGNFEDEAYSGIMQCYLESLYSAEYFNDLLADSDNQPSDWMNRGRFLDGHLIGTCASYPEFGRVRHFFVRGMEVTIAFSSIQIETDSTKKAHVKSYDLTISIKRSSQSSSSFSAPATAPQPKWFYTADTCPDSG